MLAMEEIDGCGIGVAVPGEQVFRLLLVSGKRCPQRDRLQFHVLSPPMADLQGVGRFLSGGTGSAPSLCGTIRAGRR
jgi:hypothetical protein